jgi:hypothetical protein
MDERRRLKRKHLFFYTRVFDIKGGVLLGHLENITPAGLMVISEKPVELNKEYHLRIDLPEYEYNRTHLELHGRSLWSQPDVDPSFHTTGFQLFDVSEEESAIILRINQEYGFRD